MELFHRKQKPLIVTIHGFGTKGRQEMEPLRLFLKSKGYECRTFDIFNPRDKSDISMKAWILRCEEQMKKAFAHHKDIVLIGFSMGGVIASYLATIFPVRQLILIAPAFTYLDWSKIEKAGKGLISSSGKSSDLSMVQKQTFMNVVDTYRSSIAHVDCPVLIIHGTSDEVIPPKSSRKAFYAIPHENKRLVYLEGAKHRLLYDGKMEPLAFALILDMIENRLL